jgi:uncharacterized protein (DUF1697 family)
VTTYVQSGNVVYRRTRAPGRVAKEIEVAVRAELGFEIRILGRTHPALERIVAADPFPGADPARRLVLFLEAAPARTVAAKLGRVTSGRDEAILIGQEFHLHCPDGLGTTKLIGLLSDRRLGVAVTGRNWRTVTRLLELSGDQSSGRR